MEIQTKEEQKNNETQFSDYISFLQNQKKIIGVKDNSQKIKISNNPGIKKTITICTILALSAFVLSYLNIGMFFMGIGVFLIFLDFVLIIMLLDRDNVNSLKISYPSNETIKINKYLLNYKENNIMINIENNHISESSKEHDYTLLINGEKDTYSIELNLKQENQLEDFIDNLIFEPKNKEREV